jgi:hypothetical protein
MALEPAGDAGAAVDAGAGSELGTDGGALAGAPHAARSVAASAMDGAAARRRTEER